MSSEWTIVTGNKRNIKVVSKQPVAVVEKKAEVRQVRPTREEKIQKENEKRERWEQNRQKKIDEYNAEFPLLPGSKDLVTDTQKNRLHRHQNRRQKGSQSQSIFGARS
jgi:hypothetical protein